ncbi:MAG TPA: peptide ABC transporter substrate-binding protein [Gemmatimonadaceae bacterium]|nr:peptide ABC transporter substrate-binding protein [Gemmatimonadaceae bacterium]
MPGARIASIVALLAIGGGSLACTGPVRASDVVVFASGTDLESANPLVTIHPLSRQVQRHVLFVTLARYDSALVPQPYFARAWRWSADRRTLDLVLFASLRWSDGTPTNARDVVFTIDRARDPHGGYARAADLASVVAASVSSDTTVRITFATPQRALPAIFCELPILPEHVLATVSAADMRRASFGTAPVSNGPFRLRERVVGQRWVFDRNVDFPAALGGSPKTRELVIAVVDEPTTKFAGLASGDLDFAGIAPTMASLAARDPVIRVVSYPILFSTALMFNAHRPPFDDVRVRQAVDLSIDRARLVSAALAGFGTPASGPVPPENPFALRRAPVLDARRADSLLDAAGWQRGAGGWRAREHPFSIELLTVGSGDNAIEQLVQADLALRGIRVEIRQVELGAFLAIARAPVKNFDVLITGVSGDLSLAYLSAMYDSPQRGGVLDYANFHSATLDSAFAQTRAARTDAQAREAWLAVQRELEREMPAAWLYHSRGVQGVSARMRDVRMDLRGELATVARWRTAEKPAVAGGGR